MNTVPPETTALTIKLRTSKLRNRRLIQVRKATGMQTDEYEREETDIA